MFYELYKLINNNINDMLDMIDVMLGIETLVM